VRINSGKGKGINIKPHGHRLSPDCRKTEGRDEEVWDLSSSRNGGRLGERRVKGMQKSGDIIESERKFNL